VLRLVPRPWAAVAVGLLVAGIVLLVLGADVAAFFVGGLGAVLVVALAFYAVGRSEDVEREREAERRRPG
jgi:membrane-bound ClpP family serine protease